MVQPRQAAKRRPDEPASQPEPGATMIYKPKGGAASAAADAPPPEVEREVAVLSWDGRTMRVDKRRVLLGRSREGLRRTLERRHRRRG